MRVNKGKSFLAILLLVLIVVSINVFLPTRSPLFQHIYNNTNFKVLSVTDNMGEIDIILGIADNSDYIGEKYIQLETKILFLATKMFPRTTEELEMLKNVTVRFRAIKTKREISEIRVNAETLLTINWGKIASSQLIEYVDYYYYQP